MKLKIEQIREIVKNVGGASKTVKGKKRLTGLDKDGNPIFTEPELIVVNFSITATEDGLEVEFNDPETEAVAKLLNGDKT